MRSETVALMRAQSSELRTQNCRQYGFTLIEMVVVIVIISLAAILVIPRLPSTDAANLRSSARRLATVIRYLGDQSVTTKIPYRIRLELADDVITVVKNVNGDESAPSDPFFTEKILREGVAIEDVEISQLGKLTEGTVTVDFGMAGLGDVLVIHLKGNKGDHFTVTALPYGGKVEVLEGYQELKSWESKP